MVEVEITQERVESLEAQLADRDQLVTALTERLEQAAEQLDRLHRTGADRGARSGILGIPPEMIAQQQKLVEDLQQAVQHWEDMQPGAFFGRLENQLNQIHNLVSNQDGHSSRASTTDAVFTRSEPAYEPETPRRGGLESNQSVLNFLKSTFQSDGTSAPASSPTEASSPSEDGAVRAPSAPLTIDLPALQDPPEPIDAATASTEELAKACEIRDNYVVYLLQRLRQIESIGHVPHSWAGLESLPDELRSRLEALEKRLEETLRLAEVELSLQRARLAREEVRIRVMDEQVQKELKKVRQTASDQSDAENDKGGEQSNSRWKRMLGRRGENG